MTNLPIGATFILSTAFILLVNYGYYLLWNVPVNDGSFKAIVKVKQAHRFPNNNLLKSVYTGIHKLDDWLLTPVIFYEGLLDGTKLPHLLMLMDVHASMQATATVMLVRLVVHHRCSTVFTAIVLGFWGTLNQAYGAASVYPTYFLAEILVDMIRSFIKAPAHLSPLPHSTASALYIMTLAGFLFPLVFASPALLGLRRQWRQNIIAYYRLGPLLFSLLYVLLNSLDLVLPHYLAKWSSEDVVATTLDMATTFAAFFHITAILIPLIRPYSLATLKRVFLPNNAYVAEEGKDVITNTAHRFLQYDLYVVGAAFLLWSVWVSQGLEDWNPLGIVALSSIGCVLFGPGAMLAQVVKLEVKNLVAK